MSYEKIWYEHAKKWRFNDGLHGVIGSYSLVLSNGVLKLLFWVTDKRYSDSRKIKTIYSTEDANTMHQYLTENEPK